MAIPIMILSQVIRAALPTAIEIVANRKGKPKAEVKPEEIDYDELARVVEAKAKAKIESDPQLRNAANAEPVVRSRIAVGGFGTVFVAGFALLRLTVGVPFAEWEWELVGAQLGIIWAGTEVMRGRLQSGLKPLFSRWID